MVDNWNKTCNNNGEDTRVSWYTRQKNNTGTDEEDIIRVPVDVLSDKKNTGTHECSHKCDKTCQGKPVSKYDEALREFILECEQLDNIMQTLNRESDFIGLTTDFYNFRKGLEEIKEKAIVSAYSRKCFRWKHEQ